MINLKPIVEIIAKIVITTFFDVSVFVYACIGLIIYVLAWVFVGLTHVISKLFHHKYMWHSWMSAKTYENYLKIKEALG